MIKKKNKLRVYAAVERLSPEQRKRTFAANLDALLKITGMQRKEAAEQIGLPYKLMRRLVSSGVSRVDARNEDTLEKIVAYFGLHVLDDLWQPDLLNWLLNPEYGKAFINRFRGRLTTSWDQVKKRPQLIDESLRKLIFEDVSVESPFFEYSEKVKTILKSSKAKQFKQLIDDYFEFISEEHEAA